MAIEYAGGLDVVAPAPDVQPGDPPTGLRVLDFRRDGADYVLELEGLGSRTYDLELRGEPAPGNVRGVVKLARPPATARLSARNTTNQLSTGSK